MIASPSPRPIRALKGKTPAMGGTPKLAEVNPFKKLAGRTKFASLKNKVPTNKGIKKV